jgi:phage-related protein
MGVELVVKLATGLVQAIPTLVGKIPQLISSVLNAIGKLPGMVVDIGKNIVSGIWTGISNMASWLWNKISGWCSDIFNSIKNFFGIHSPSKLFADKVGKMLGLGVGEGFDDSLSSVYRDMQKAINHENAKLTSNLTSNQIVKTQLEDNRQATLQSIDDNKEIIVNSTTKLDSKVIARETNKVNARRQLQYSY